jgi:hypothetical protein
MEGSWMVEKRKEDENSRLAFPAADGDWLGWFWEKQPRSVALA